AAPLSVAVDGALHHIGAGGDALERVGHRELAVVVSVDSHTGGCPGVAQPLRHSLHPSTNLHRKAAAVGVAQNDPGGAGRGRSRLSGAPAIAAKNSSSLGLEPGNPPST